MTTFWWIMIYTCIATPLAIVLGQRLRMQSMLAEINAYRSMYGKLDFHDRTAQQVVDARGDLLEEAELKTIELERELAYTTTRRDYWEKLACAENEKVKLFEEHIRIKDIAIERLKETISLLKGQRSVT